MSVNESGLKRTITKEEQLQKKLVHVRKKRDDTATKVQRITKKKKMTNGDVQRLGRYNIDLLKWEKEITKLISEIQKNTSNMEKYKKKITQEQDIQFKSMIQSINTQRNTNKQYLRKHDELSSELTKLTKDIERSVEKKQIIEYDLFLSHSSLDKEKYVSELSDNLESKGLEVFEDVKVFKIGDSQTEMMNMGILNSRFVVVFLSHNFIKSGWSDYEFKSFLNREINEKRIIILPIWHNVSYEDVRDYSPYLVDKFALDTGKYSIDEIVESISQVVEDSKQI